MSFKSTGIMRYLYYTGSYIHYIQSIPKNVQEQMNESVVCDVYESSIFVWNMPSFMASG